MVLLLLETCQQRMHVSVVSHWVIVLLYRDVMFKLHEK